MKMGTKRKEELATVKLEEGDSKKMIATLMAVRNIALDADPFEPETMKQCFDKYVGFCMLNDVKITLLSAASSMGITLKMLTDWRDLKKNTRDHRYKELADYVCGFCSEYREMLMLEGKISPITGIWWQKVYDHYTENVIIPNADQPIDDVKDVKAIAEKYKNLPED